MNTVPDKTKTAAAALAPADDGAKVKLDLAARNNDNLSAYAWEHVEMMTDNANFPNPVPAAADFQAVLEEFDVDNTAAMTARAAAKEATTRLKASRAKLSKVLDKRAVYVQSKSNGNATVILSSGLEVRNPRTPTGQLPPPSALTVDLNGVSGLMLLKWKPVPKAKNYVVQASVAVEPRDWKALPSSDKSRMQLPGMKVGTTYAFRVAAAGGSTGQSYWSPEVIRAAA